MGKPFSNAYDFRGEFEKIEFWNFYFLFFEKFKRVPRSFIADYDNMDVGEWDVYSGYPGPRWNLAVEVHKVAMFLTFGL